MPQIRLTMSIEAYTAADVEDFLANIQKSKIWKNEVVPIRELAKNARVFSFQVFSYVQEVKQYVRYALADTHHNPDIVTAQFVSSLYDYMTDLV